MLRSLRTLILLAAALTLVLAPVAGAAAKSSPKKAKKVTYPTVTKVSPAKAGIGDTMTITGKGYRPGKNKNTVIFKRKGARAVFVKAGKATKTKLTITLPAKLLPFLLRKDDTPQYTRFQVRVLTTKFGKSYTKVSKSPLIGPLAGAVGTADDCDGDGVRNAADTDDDNDLLSDTEEARLGLQSCNRDTDGDGMSDGWEQFSAIDRNGAAKPAPTRRSYPNALDPKDGTEAIDHDGDGLSNLDEYTAWATYGGNKVPLSYSGGNPASAGRTLPAGMEYMDQDGNGFLSDLERDADGDGISNKDETRGQHTASRGVAGGDPTSLAFHDYGIFSELYIEWAAERTADPMCAGINQVPYYCVQDAKPTALNVQKVDTIDWLDGDSDGDSIRDDADDVDHDDISNLSEYLTELATPVGDRKYGPLNACYPDIDARFCLLATVDVDKDGLQNREDTDDDGDLIDDETERKIGTEPLRADTDGDGILDGFEYKSALDLNSAALPYPGKRPYPNALDGEDADLDYDQDGLTQRQEFFAWRKAAGCARPRDPRPGESCTPPAVLTFSDGTQQTGGKIAATGAFAGLDLDGNGWVTDDEKDVDADGLNNWTEANGPLSSPQWWQDWISAKANKCTDDYVEAQYPGPPYAGLDFVDEDTDGDTVKDGADDIDHDGFTNAREAYRYNGRDWDSDGDLDYWCADYVSFANNWPMTNPEAIEDIRVQPFNPCKPIYSEACHRYTPAGYYKDEEDWASPIRP